MAVPMPLKALRASPTGAFAGGNVASGTIELHQAPPPGGLTVTLASSRPDIVTVPAQVTVTHGTASAETGPVYIASFDIMTRPVSVFTTVTVTARYGAQSLQTPLQLHGPRPKSVQLDLPDVCDGDNNATVRFELDGPAPPGGRRVMVVVSISGQYQSSSEIVTVPPGDHSENVPLDAPKCPPGPPPDNARNGCNGVARVHNVDNADPPQPQSSNVGSSTQYCWSH
jgi:hypothetical protein